MENTGKFPNSYPSERNHAALRPFPVLSVIRANEFGLIVESNRAFEIGEAMNLGFHFSRIKSDEMVSQFLSVESVVVDSQPLHTFKGERFRVTLIYSKVSARDRAAIMSLSDQPRSKTALSNLGLN